MNLVNAIEEQTNWAITDNGALTKKTTLSSLLDLFFLAGASRGKDLTTIFAKAYSENEMLATRMLLWMRDVRGGAGERQQFRNLFKYLIENDYATARKVLAKIPEIGRWDDVLVGLKTAIEPEVVEMIRKALLEDKDGLCAKWMDRQDWYLRSKLGWTPKFYRKTLVGLSQTVEQKMCANEWEGIDFSKVPSQAFNIYKNAFSRHTPTNWGDFLLKVQKGESKINASAIYPNDIVASLMSGTTQIKASDLQWKALPNYLEGSDENILVVADVSGSMGNIQDKSSPMSVCISLALYFSERLKGQFKDSFITFSNTPKLQKLHGTLSSRIKQLQTADWGMNTNLQAVFNLILNRAIKNDVAAKDMPTKIMIISDMEFDACANPLSTNFEEIDGKFRAAGYKRPDIIFWNVYGRRGNVPVTRHQTGAALLSGYSPSTIKAALGAEDFNSEEIMLKTLSDPRYDF